MKPEDLAAAAERVVEKAVARGFDESAVALQASRSTMVKLANSVVTVVQAWRSIEATVYLARDRRVYVAERSVSRPEDLERVVDEAEHLVKLLDVAEPYAPLPEPSGRPLQGLVDKRVEEMMDEAAELASEMVNGALAVHGSAKLAGMVELETGVRVVATSKGARLWEPWTSVEAYARVFVDDLSGHWAYTSTRLEERELRLVGERAAHYATVTRSRVSVEPGSYDAVLSPLVVGNLLGDLAWMASGLAVLMGFSVFAKHGVGSRIGSEAVTVIDDPHDTELPGATGFDDEGVATRRKPVIEKGVVRSLLHNAKTAAAMKTESTGNAGYVMPHPWNVVVEGGSMSEEEMVGEVRRGFLVLNNWYTRFQNYVEGVFSTVTRDALLYIENGEVKGVAARMRIADTYPKMLSAVEAASREVYKVKWWEIPFPTKAPFLLVRGLRFTKPEA